MAITDYTVTTPTTGIAALTPSRAISIYLAGSGTSSGTITFSLSDGGAGGTFYLRPLGTGAPLSVGTTTQINTGTAAGAGEQVLYMAPSGATGTITITVTCTGGLSAGPHALSVDIAAATQFAKDTFTGSATTNLTAHTPDTGSTWVKSWTSGGANLLLDGSGGAYNSGSGASEYIIPTSPSGQEYDVVSTATNIQVGKSSVSVLANAPNSNNNTGYRWVIGTGNGHYLIKYVNGTATVFFGPVSTITAGTTHTLRLAIRICNTLQYLFPLDDGVVINTTPVQDGTLTTGYAGYFNDIVSSPASTDSVMSAFFGYNADWTPSASVSVGGLSAGQRTIGMGIFGG